MYLVNIIVSLKRIITRLIIFYLKYKKFYIKFILPGHCIRREGGKYGKVGNRILRVELRLELGLRIELGLNLNLKFEVS